MKSTLHPCGADKTPMNALAIASRLIDAERETARITRIEARASVAQAAGLSPGTLENLERGRIKSPSRIRDIRLALGDLATEYLERKIRELESDLIAIRSVEGDDCPDLLGAESALETAKACLSKGGRK